MQAGCRLPQALHDADAVQVGGRQRYEFFCTEGRLDESHLGCDVVKTVPVEDFLEFQDG